MGALEIVLLIAGGIIFVMSFLLPQSKEETSEQARELAKEEIKVLVSQEMTSVRSHVDDVVDEAIGYAVEKTERSLERLTNEKMMAVNEYSDTVLEEIHKNHEEVMFLYDMLNSKHNNLKNTVSEVNRTVKEAEETKREAEAVVHSFQKLNPDKVTVVIPTVESVEQEMAQSEIMKSEAVKSETVKSKAVKSEAVQQDMPETVSSREQAEHEAQTSMDISFMQDAEGQSQNSNEKILELHKQGKSNVAIAKELGLGVGEVKLVIGLYKNM